MSFKKKQKATSMKKEPISALSQPVHIITRYKTHGSYPDSENIYN